MHKYIHIKFYLPNLHDVIVSELSLEMNQEPAKAKVEIIAILLFCKITK